MPSAEESSLSGFPMAEEWTEQWWEGAIAAADLLTDGGQRLARSALREVFPPRLVRTLREARHPVVADQFTVAGRLGLLELGVAIACAPVRGEDIDRLRNAAEYEGVAAELRGGLMFKRAGGRLRRPPIIPGHEQCEFLADFPSGERIAVEVKCPEKSLRDLDLDRVSCELAMELSKRLQWLSDVLEPCRITFHFASTILDLGNRDAVNSDLLDEAVSQTVLRISDAVSKGTFRDLDLGRLGSLEIRPEPRATQVLLSSVGPETHVRRAGTRIRRLLNKAVRQLREAHLPGIILLDLQRDTLARNAVAFFAHWARSKDSLAALLVIQRSSSATDGRMYGEVEILPGPEMEAAANVLSEVLDTCEDGHIHYNPLSTPSNPCPYTWLPRYE